MAAGTAPAGFATKSPPLEANRSRLSEQHKKGPEQEYSILAGVAPSGVTPVLTCFSGKTLPGSAEGEKEEDLFE